MPNTLPTTDQSLNYMRQANRSLTDDTTGKLVFTSNVWKVPSGSTVTAVQCNSAGTLMVHYSADPAAKYTPKYFSAGQEIGMEIDAITSVNTTVVLDDIVPLGRE
jgi:hypothetical protein